MQRQTFLLRERRLMNLKRYLRVSLYLQLTT
jgi:hypothetical protein